MRATAIVLLYALSMSCGENFYKVPEFTADELRWFEPFNNERVVIYVSEKNERDTITFTKVIADSDSTRSINTGFVNTNFLSVPYTFSPGSYHQASRMSDGVTRYEHHFASLEKSSSGTNNLEITFIGMFFSDEQLQNIRQVADSLFFFDSKRATYPGINVEKEISSFTFQVGRGVVEYVDARNVKWRMEEDTSIAD